MQGSDHGGQASFAAQEQREPLLADELPLEADEVRPHRPILYASMGLCAFRSHGVHAPVEKLDT